MSGEDISSIFRSLNISPPSILGKYKALLTQWLKEDAKLPKKQRRTVMRLFEGLVDEGYTGAYVLLSESDKIASARHVSLIFPISHNDLL